MPFDGDAHTNIVLPGCHGSSLACDRDADASEPWRLVAWSWRDERYGTWRSADGLAWTRCPGGVPIADGQEVISVARRPDTGGYFAFHRVWGRDRPPQRRLIAASRSPDLLTWQTPMTILVPDELDDPRAELYDLSGFWYEDRFVGLLPVFRVTSYEPGRRGVDGADVSAWDGPIEAQLASSADGLQWQRFEDRAPIIPRGPAGSFDAGCILGLADAPVIADDRLWIYYTAVNTTHGGPMPPKEITIGLASWRLDGFVSLEAGAEGGVVETIPLSAGGPQLEVNLEAPGGSLEVEALAPDGRVLPGCSRAECRPVAGDSVRAAVRWKERSGLDPSRRLRLRFHLRDGRLYSFGFAEAS